MDMTLKLLSEELKRMLKLEKGKRLKADDWNNVYTISFTKDGNFSLNDKELSSFKIKWDLQHIFKFKNIRTLYIANLPDHTLFTAGGKESFDFKFWFRNFENLNGLNLKLGSFENNREARCFKIDLRDESSWILHYTCIDGNGIEIWVGDKLVKHYFFGLNKKKSQDWFMNILEYLLQNREIPDDDWIEDLKMKDTNKSFKERVAIIKKAENTPEIEEKLY